MNDALSLASKRLFPNDSGGGDGGDFSAEFGAFRREITDQTADSTSKGTTTTIRPSVDVVHGQSALFPPSCRSVQAEAVLITYLLGVLPRIASAPRSVPLMGLSSSASCPWASRRANYALTSTQSEAYNCSLLRTWPFFLARLPSCTARTAHVPAQSFFALALTRPFDTSSRRPL